MRAILSDIHGNLEALQAVLADAADWGATEILCLGDLVGYGPNPVECLTFSMSWPVVLQGCYDFTALSNDDLSGWTALAAARSIFWFRTLVQQSAEAARGAAFLSQRPLIHEEGGVTFVHATPNNPLYEYLFPGDIDDPQKLERIGSTFRHYCFNGHTHVPGVFFEDGPGAWTYRSELECDLSRTQCDQGFRVDGRKTICNVGSVGQPRDGDWRACYVLFDGEVVRWRRVSYDIEAVIKKIYANPELANFLGDRLRDGL